MSAKTADSGRTRKLWIAGASAAVLIAVFVLGGITIARAQKPAVPSVVTEAATTETLTVLVTADGDIRAAKQTAVDPPVSGDIEEVFVELGSVVKAGDTLFTISSVDADSALLRANASLAQAKQSVAQASQMRAQADQTTAQSHLTIAQARASVLQAQQALDAAYAAPVTVPGSAEKIELAKRQLESAQAALTTAEAGTKSAQAAVTTAQAAVAAANAGLASAQNAYEAAERDVASTVVTAPVDGLVTSLSLTAGGSVAAASSASASIASAGMGVAAGASSGSTSAVVISDVSTLAMRVSVNEADLPKIAVGQTATVRVDAVPDAEITAEVTWISPNATSSSGVVSYDVDLRLIDHAEAVKPGMTATAEITAAVIENATVVPSQAIRVDGSSRYVDVVLNGSTRKTVITTGASNAELTQVLAGIVPGDEVVVDDGAAPEPASMMPFGGN
ncbi:MAG: efflux RND transporter periplasmic adaptor subunit [Coriobacteriia bacterium]